MTKGNYQISKKRLPLSAGLLSAKKGNSFEECYTKADKALYYVKQNGKR